MMYCERCRQSGNLEITAIRSLGPCEYCGKTCLCYDRVVSDDEGYDGTEITCQVY